MTTTVGKLLDISTYPAGSAVVDTPASGRIPVADPFQFPGDGGTVLIEDVLYPYDSVDYDTSELVGGSLPTPAVDTPVLLDPYAETKIASVSLNDEGDQLFALVPHDLSALLEDGLRDPDNAETVTLIQPSLGRWEVSDVLDTRAELTPEAGENLPPPDPSDGVPPELSPDATAIGGIGAVFVRWVPAVNADPVSYQVHVGTFPDFVPDGTTLVAETPASSISVRTLPDGSPLLYDTAYYFQIVAADADGAAAPGAVAAATLFRVTGPDIAADYVYAGNLVADQIIGGTINTDLLLAGAIKTAAAGSRVELGPFGIVVYNPAGVPTTLLGSDGTSTFKGAVIASTLSVTDGMSIRGTANEVAQAGSITLAAGVSAAANAPTVVNDYELMPGWLTSGGDAWPAGYEFKGIQRFGTKWLVGAREVATDKFFGRAWNDDGTFSDYYGIGWTGQQIQRCTLVDSGHPLYAFRQTDRRIIAATHSTNGGSTTNALSWDFATNTQPAGTTEVGTVSYSSGSVLVSATSGVPDSSLEQTGTMDMRGRRLTVKVVPSGSVSADGQVVEVRTRNATAGEYILARFEGETGLLKIKLQTFNGSPGSTKTALASVVTGYNYWRLSESNGDAMLQVSTTGTAWSNVATITDHGLTDADLASMSLGLIVRAGDAGEATTSRFDDVSVGYGFVDYGDTIAWLDATNPPALGTDGTYILAAERTSGNLIKIYEIDPRSPGRVVTTYTSGVSTDFAFVTPLVTVSKGSFDFGSTRFIVTTGNSGDQWAAVFTVSGTTLTYQRNESFYIPGQGGTGWDGTQFQTLATDGARRKHTAVTWTDVPAWSKTWYAATTWYDGDGTTHETTPSPRAAFTFRKRSRYTVTSGDIPDLGGVDDPDRIRVYLASGLATTLYRQATTAAGVNSSVLTTATFSGTAAPVSNDFPNAVAARIVNAGGTLEISGDGSIEGTVIAAATALTSPLATFTSLIVTDRTFVQVISSGLDPVPTTLTDVPGLTSAVDVDSTGDIYLVMMTLDVDLVAVAPAFPFEARLMVNSVLQTPNGLWRAVSGSAAAQRATVSQQWLITGQAAGSRTFKIQARAAGGGGTAYRVNATHSQMTITQQQ